MICCGLLAGLLGKFSFGAGVSDMVSVKVVKTLSSSVLCLDYFTTCSRVTIMFEDLGNTFYLLASISSDCGTVNFGGKCREILLNS